MDLGTEPAGLSSLLRSRTRALHGQAERSGIVADILHGQVTRRGYALFLRNLLPAYQRLEAGLEQHRMEPAIRDLARREIYRSDALRWDLVRLCGAGWRQELPLLPAGRGYADCIAAAADGAGEGLLGHAYVRYLGDLNGGQVLKRLLAKSLDLPPHSLTFYEFPQIEDLVAFRVSYRESLDRSARSIVNWSMVMESAVEAFLINIQVSEAVRRAAAESTIDRA